jgi:hypothetical protein
MQIGIIIFLPGAYQKTAQAYGAQAAGLLTFFPVFPRGNPRYPPVIQVIDSLIN